MASSLGLQTSLLASYAVVSVVNRDAYDRTIGTGVFVADAVLLATGNDDRCVKVGWVVRRGKQGGEYDRL